MTRLAGRLVFRPRQRLLSAAAFAAVLSSPRRRRGKHFELRCRSGDHVAARLGVIVPKRLAKHAVVRNAVKRVSREAFRHLQHQLPPVDVVVRLVTSLNRQGQVSPQLKRDWRIELDRLMLGLPS